VGGSITVLSAMAQNRYGSKRIAVNIFSEPSEAFLAIFILWVADLEQINFITTKSGSKRFRRFC
jgi:hypothetical protein